ncbi:Neural proliferation differentiation and control protein 1 [Nymphon striatum]|nr:Neural proliferation differentiation and control protein 1 [Nymphon striatum]
MELVKRTLRYFLKLFFPTENAIFISIITFVTWSGDVTKSVEREERLEKGRRWVDDIAKFDRDWTRGLCSAVGQYGLMMMNVFLTHCPTLNNILQKNTKAAADTEYPAYGVTGPNKGDNTSPSGDRKLAQSAQMYHYQHQKQQMIALEKAGTDRNQSASDVDSEEENEEGDYTVYECPGLAPTGEMEVKNPLFNEQPTPTSPSLKKSNYNENETLPEKESTKM